MRWFSVVLEKVPAVGKFAVDDRNVDVDDEMLMLIGYPYVLGS